MAGAWRGTWQLPVLERKTINEQYIKHNALYHYYEYEESEEPGISLLAKSMCGRHMQNVNDFESIESGQILQFPAIACKKCFEKWKREFYIGS